jgi:hypothetical protein
MARAIAERLVMFSLPVEAVAHGRDDVALALILANEHGPGFELATCRALVSHETLQEPYTIAIKTAKSSLLQARRHHATHRSLLRPAGGTRPNTSRHCRRSASSRNERIRSISAAVAAGSRQRRRMIRRLAAQGWRPVRSLLACHRQRSGKHGRRRRLPRQA